MFGFADNFVFTMFSFEKSLATSQTLSWPANSGRETKLRFDTMQEGTGRRGRITPAEAKRQSGHAGKSVHPFPAAAGTGESVDPLDFHIRERGNEPYPEIGKSIDDLYLCIQFFSPERAIPADFACKRRRCRKGPAEGADRNDEKATEFHGGQMNG